MNEQNSFSPVNNSAVNSHLLNDELDLSSDSSSLRRPILDEENRRHSSSAIQEPSLLQMKSSLIFKQEVSSGQINVRPTPDNQNKADETFDSRGGTISKNQNGFSSDYQNPKMESEKVNQLNGDGNFEQYTVRMSSLNKSAIYKSHITNSQIPPNLSHPQNGIDTANNSYTQVQLQKDLFPRHDQNILSSSGCEPLLPSEVVPQQYKYTPPTPPIPVSPASPEMANPMRAAMNLVSKLKMKARMKKLLESTSFRRLLRLSDNQYKLIQDLAIWREDRKRASENNKLSLRSIAEAMTFVTFNPYSPYKLTWDMFIIFVNVFFFVSVPLLLSTGLNYDQMLGSFPFYSLALILLVDAFVNLNTGYYKGGQLVTSKYMVIINYAQESLFIDIFGIIPLLIYTIMQDDSPKQLLFCFFIKYKSVTKIFKRFELRLNLKASVLHKIALLKLFFTVLFIAHMFANFWLNLASYSSENWLSRINFDLAPWHIKYMKAFYFTTVTMVTVGYGDIFPNNNTETFCSIITIFFACAVFAYSVNSIGSILEEINKEEKMLTQNMQIINQYMDKKKISHELRFLVREYLEFFYREQDSSNTDAEQEIIDQLANNLKEKLFIEANSMILKDNKVFSDKFSEQALMKTLSIVKEFKFTPQEVIFQKESIDDSSVYFIEHGGVEVFIENQKTQKIISIQKLEKGQYFGEIGFYTGMERSMSVRALDFTTLLKIERTEFLELLKSFPKDEEKFHMIKDQIIQGFCLGENGLKCYSCQSSDHLLGACPMVQYVPNKFIHYKRVNYNPGQSRESFKRFKKDKCSTLKDIDLVQEAAENIQDEYPNLYLTFLPEELDDSDESFTSSSELDEYNPPAFIEFKKPVPVPTTPQKQAPPPQPPLPQPSLDRYAYIPPNNLYQNQIPQPQPMGDNLSGGFVPQSMFRSQRNNNYQTAPPLASQYRDEMRSISNSESKPQVIPQYVNHVVKRTAPIGQQNIIREDSEESDSGQSTNSASRKNKSQKPERKRKLDKLEIPSNDAFKLTLDANGDKKNSPIQSPSPSPTLSKPRLSLRKSNLSLDFLDSESSNASLEDVTPRIQEAIPKAKTVTPNKPSQPDPASSAKPVTPQNQLQKPHQPVPDSMSQLPHANNPFGMPLPQYAIPPFAMPGYGYPYPYPQFLGYPPMDPSQQQQMQPQPQQFMFPPPHPQSYANYQMQLQNQMSPHDPRIQAIKGQAHRSVSSPKGLQSMQQQSRFGSKLVIQGALGNNSNSTNQSHNNNIYEMPRQTVPQPPPLPQCQLVGSGHFCCVINQQVHGKPPHNPGSRKKSSVSSIGGLGLHSGLFGAAAQVNQKQAAEMAVQTDQISKKINAIYEKLLGQYEGKDQLEFDKYQDYTVYFPNSNLVNVLLHQANLKKPNKLMQALHNSQRDLSFSYVEDTKIRSMLNSVFQNSPVATRQEQSKLDTTMSSPRLKGPNARPPQPRLSLTNSLQPVQQDSNHLKQMQSFEIASKEPQQPQKK